METLSIVEIWKYLRWLPKLILRKVFSKQRLADLIYIDVQARHTSVEVNLGKIAEHRIYFRIINMSPFDVELDRAEIEFNCAGTSLKVKHIKTQSFKAGEIGSLYITDEISSAKANQIAKFHKSNGSRIAFHGEFKCALHDFPKELHNLEGINVRYINAHMRANVEQMA
ncbi:hypothetical protein HUO09_05590 [Vibrio sp. Y2-5]|uniref:hypothetical protein n=1 Tax=Vibrio sp. Y2-5 TaxID=2743977 RepID=UPI00166007DC|nr:hypothetical protein [Vibrio sp. Y2-5]MBD0785805.1 hypothetical protein [Vibrio sp. Y2-5]